MKLISSLIILFTLLTFTPSVSADTTTRWDVFIYFANQHKDSLPQTYQYIDLHHLNVQVDSELEDALQILVYLDLIKNSRVDIWADSITSPSEVLAIEKKLALKPAPKAPTTITIKSWLDGSADLWDKEDILHNVYNTLSNSHYDRGEFEKNQLTQWAIKGIAEAADDKYTSYFPPVESEDFFQILDWEYEWIWSYVDMPTPWELIIVTPIVWSPSEAAGIKWWDRVTHVDDKEILEENSLKEVITWIKGPAWSQVKLTILRDGESAPLDIYVVRAKIVLKDIEHEKIDNNTYYVQIKNFGENVDSEFKLALEAILEEKNIKKIIFDLRNNPGGYLGEVSSMLSYFVEKGLPTAIVDYGNRQVNYTSRWYDLIDLSDYEVIFLQNRGSASASEIMVWTVKDYFPNTVIIWEQSFGKWSVQSLKTYSDGSTLKYTTAKWFTGNTKQWIDGKWITPDIELEFDDNRWNTFKKDNQLEKAISY